MKSLLIVLILAAPSFAQTVPSLDLYPIGKNFGANGSFQFGIDRSQTVGACAGYDIPGHIFLTGPCRDLFILAHAGKSVAHLGVFLGYGLSDLSKSHPYWSARAGINVGAASNAFLVKIGGDVPAFDSLSSYQAPGWLAYLGSISTVDYFVGYDGAKSWAHGPQAAFNIPLADLASLLGSFGAK